MILSTLGFPYFLRSSLRYAFIYYIFCIANGGIILNVIIFCTHAAVVQILHLHVVHVHTAVTRSLYYYATFSPPYLNLYIKKTGAQRFDRLTCRGDETFTDGSVNSAFI